MRFAALTFRIAAIVGFLTIVPMYFLYGAIGRADPPALNHPQFYFGFLGVTLAWQVLFFVLSTDPVRYRAMMIPAVLEKAGFLAAVLVLLSLKMMNAQQAIVTLPDAILLVFFIAAFRKTPRQRDSSRDEQTIRSAIAAS
jgi:hypothetical protein